MAARTAASERSFAPTAAPIVFVAVLVGAVLGGLVSALLLTAAGSERQNGTGTLIAATVAGAVVLLVSWRLARSGSETASVQLGLVPRPAPIALGLLAAGAALVAVVVAAWTQVVDVRAALPIPAQITGGGVVDRLFGGAERGAVDVDLGVLAGLLGAGVVAPWTAEIVLRGVAMPALSAWRGPLLAVPVVSVLGLASGVGSVVDGDLILCVLVLQVVLSLLRLATGSLLPSIVLSSLVTGLALGVALNWSAVGASFTAVACAAASVGLTALAVLCLDAFDRS